MIWKILFGITVINLHTDCPYADMKMMCQVRQKGRCTGDVDGGFVTLVRTREFTDSTRKILLLESVPTFTLTSAGPRRVSPAPKVESCASVGLNKRILRDPTASRVRRLCKSLARSGGCFGPHVSLSVLDAACVLRNIHRGSTTKDRWPLFATTALCVMHPLLPSARLKVRQDVGCDREPGSRICEGALRSPSRVF